MKRYVYLSLGLASLALGAIGTVFPVIPTVPFLMLSAFCFARSSQKLHNWFIGTKLYQDNLADFVAGKGMTKAAKVRIMTTITIVMAIGFAIMFSNAIYIPCYILAGVWAMHILIFLFGIKTCPAKEAVAV